jgi:type I restriction enzyme S subunit
MNPETFFDKFGLLADTPNGVQKLRDLILQLAVQGKLVPQDPNDEPAAVLLEKIKSTNQNIKKPFSKINEDENLCELPKSWKWVRLGEIITLEYGKNLPKSKRNQSGKYPVYGSNGIVGYHDKFLTKEFAIIVGRKGSAGALNISSEPSWTTDVSYFIIPPDGMILNFIFVLLKSLKLDKLGKGIKPGLNRNEAYELIVSLPPHEEQKRIVAKVDQLMALCNELEARQQNKQEARLRLNSAALDKLLTAHEPAEFANHWQRVCDNFDLLYDNPKTVGELRKSILQLAVQGKLVRQDEDDEPAAVLLGEIKAEKERLVKEGKIKKSKALPPIEEGMSQYNLPEGWVWVRLDDISEIGTGSTPLKSNLEYYNNGLIPWVTSSATSSEKIDSSNIFVTEKALVECRLRLYPIGTLIIALYGQGKTRGQVSELNIETTINQACAAIIFFEHFEDIKQYVKLVLYKKYDELRALAAGGAQPNLNVGKIKGTILPLPPLEEQHRIVTRLNQLMALCDELEAKLNQSHTDGAKLMEAVVAELVSDC